MYVYPLANYLLKLNKTKVFNIYFFRRAVQLYAFRKCLGTREILQEVSETQSNGRVFKKQIRGEYNWLTFAQVDTRARNLGNGLTALGQRRKENIVIFAETRAEWMIALQSCFANSFPGM